jgi:hypothetical protein
MIELRLGSPLLQDERVFAHTVRNALNAIVILNVATLRANPRFPLIYQSGVVFENEPEGEESFVDCVCCLRQGWGDCAHLSAWRVAELIVRFKTRASLCIKWKRYPEHGLRLFHVMVRLPDRRIEDISRNLGMGQKKAG